MYNSGLESTVPYRVSGKWLHWLTQFTKILRDGENLFENISKILEQFWISCKVTKKILKRPGCNFRETLQTFSENFEKIFKHKKCWNNVNVKEILVTHIQEILKTFLWNFQKIIKKFRDLRKIMKTLGGRLLGQAVSAHQPQEVKNVRVRALLVSLHSKYLLVGKVVRQFFKEFPEGYCQTPQIETQGFL